MQVAGFEGRAVLTLIAKQMRPQRGGAMISSRASVWMRLTKSCPSWT